MANFGQIIKRIEDSSYVITKNGYPYHVPNESEYAELWQEVDAYAQVNPAMVTLEYPPPPAPPYIPTSISPRQVRLILLNMGLLDNIEAMLAQLPREAQIEWEFAGSIDRESPLVQALIVQLGLSESDVDNIFTEASKI